MAQILYFQKEKVEYNVSSTPSIYREYYDRVKATSKKAENDLNLDLYELSFVRWLKTHIVSGRTGIREDGKTWVMATRDIICEKLRCSVSTATRILRKLEDKGYIKRKCFKYCSARYFTLVCSAFFCVGSCSGGSPSKVDILYLNPSLKYNISSREISRDISGEVGQRTAQLEESGEGNVLGADSSERFPAESRENHLQSKEKGVAPREVSREMLRYYNESVGSGVELSETLSRELFAAYKQKFELSLPCWKRYVISKTHGVINDPLRFLFYILKFSTIDGYKSFLSLRKEVDFPKGKESTKSKAKKPADSNLAMRIIEHHDHEEERTVLRKFYNEYGLGALLNHFSYGKLHLRGSNLSIYFKSDWFMDRFMNDSEIAAFREWCEKYFKFECEIDGSIERLGEGF